MDQNERINSKLITSKAQLRGLQASLWTALPGIIQSFDKDKMTCEVQPAIKANVQDLKTGKVTATALPLLVDVPVAFPGGGGFVMTFPLAAGDNGIVIFSSRCIDNWWQNGGVQTQADLRLHDLSDGMFIPRMYTQNALPAGGVSTNTVQLRSDDGQGYLELGAGHTLKAVFPGGIDLEGPLTINGVPVSKLAGGQMLFGAPVLSSGDIKANVSGTGTGGVSLGTHGHTSTNPGTRTSNPVT